MFRLLCAAWQRFRLVRRNRRLEHDLHTVLNQYGPIIFQAALFNARWTYKRLESANEWTSPEKSCTFTVHDEE